MIIVCTITQYQRLVYTEENILSPISFGFSACSVQLIVNHHKRRREEIWPVQKTRILLKLEKLLIYRKKKFRRQKLYSIDNISQTWWFYNEQVFLRFSH